MAYTKQTWTAREGTNLKKYTKSSETATTVILTNTPDSITVAGTPFSVDRMNHIENGIELAHNNIDDFYKRDTELYKTFVDAEARNYFAMASNGSDVYVSVDGGDIYKQTAATGNFTAQSFTSRAYYGLTCLGTSLYAAVGLGDIYKQTNGTGTLDALSQTSRAWRGMSNNGTDVFACVYNATVGGDGGLYKQTAGTGDFVLYHAHEALIMDVLCAGGDIYYCVANGDIYKQTASTGSFVAQGVTKNWTSLAYINGDVYAFAENDGIYRQNDRAGAFNKIADATIEEIRGSVACKNFIYYAQYAQFGIFKFTAPPKALEVYSTAETLTNQTFLGYPVYRKVINFGVLPNATNKSVAHGIPTPYKIKSVTGIASSSSDEVPLPHASSNGLTYHIHLFVRKTDNTVVIGTGKDRSEFTKTYVTIEYIKALI